MEASDITSLSGEDAGHKAKPVTIHIAYTVTLGLRYVACYQVLER